MGFGDKWCKWVESILASSTMSILVNGSPTEEFRLERGVRQGDPLSPFLFILASEGLNAIVSEAVEKGIFRGVKIGSNREVVSYLQYVDDTIFIGEWNKENARSLMCILKCFEEVSGLRINFNKSKLYGIGVNDVEVIEMSRWMRCGIGEFPFTYLGLPTGENMRRIGAWNTVIEKFKKRLSEWKAKSMSFGGHLTLVKSVLGDVKWVVGEGLNGGGVWRDIIKVGGVIEGLGIEFMSSFEGVVGNGRDVGFWLDKWVGDLRLCDRFPRLYHLDRRKEGRVVDKGKWVNNEWVWEWEWVKSLRCRVCKDLDELKNILQSVVISNDCRDRWKWMLHEGGNFTVKELSRLVEEKILRSESSFQETLWNKLVPKKVNIFIWRALKGRIPVREELDKRGIDLDTLLSPCYDSMVESCTHCLVLCNLAMSVWEKIFKWWKVRNVNAFSIGDLFNSNGTLISLTILSCLASGYLDLWLLHL
ncbi:reverse transcriptase domain, reverse transcriptase zinc-binding domain protein [Tanacetum coccineum]